MRMPRVYTYYDKSGRGKPNTDRLLIPFRLMTQVGDWCELFESPECIAGNVAAVCSMYSKKLGRRFSFKDRKDGTYRITVKAAKPPKPATRRATRTATGHGKVPASVLL